MAVLVTIGPSSFNKFGFGFEVKSQIDAYSHQPKIVK